MSDEIVPLLVTEKAAAAMIGVSASTLIANRFKGTPLLPYVRIGKRGIRYRTRDIHEFVDQDADRRRTDVASRVHGATPSGLKHRAASNPGKNID